MSESICVVLEKFATCRIACNDGINILSKIKRPLEIKLSFDGEQHFIEEAWLDNTIDFYAIADKYNFLDKLLEEALKQLKEDKKEALLDRAYVESFD